MGMDMLGIAVGGYLHLMPRPCLGCELQPNLVSLLISYFFFWRKGLNILVEVDPIHLAIGGLGGQKFHKGIGPVTVQSGHISDTGFRVGGLVLPLTIAHHSLHGADVLLGFLDVGYSCQLLPPMRTSSS